MAKVWTEEQKNYDEELKKLGYDATERAVAKMMLQNTGQHMLDSGGAYGRAWQRRQEQFAKGLHPKARPEFELEVWDKDDWYGSINIFHYLTAFLEYDPGKDRSLHEFGRSEEWKNEPWLATMRAWAKDYTQRYGGVLLGTTNTYNYENNLGAVIQYVMFGIEDEYDTYVALQIHNGCDVRGGYSAPHVFKITDRDYFIMSQTDLFAFEHNTDNRWYTDDGHHWYAESGPDPKDNKLPVAKVDKENDILYSKRGNQIEVYPMLQY